jgi:hypothetical protein
VFFGKVCSQNVKDPAKEFHPERGSKGFWMKLEANPREVSVAYPLRDLGAILVLVPSFDAPARGEGLGVGSNGVVTADFEGLGEAFEEACSMVMDLRSSPMKDFLAEPKTPPRLLDKGLGTQTNTKDGELWRCGCDGLKEATGLRGASRPRREHQGPGGTGKDFGGIRAIAPCRPGGKAEAPEGLFQVKNEAVSIV